MTKHLIHVCDGRYLIFDVSTIRWLREQHRICGVLTGTLPQVPQQNVFSGIPLELTSNEIYYLTYTNAKESIKIVDDEAGYKSRLCKVNNQDINKFEAERYNKRLQRSKQQIDYARTRSSQVTGRVINDDNNIEETANPDSAWYSIESESVDGFDIDNTHEVTILGPPADLATCQLYVYLNRQGYFVTPGLRFGCQLLAYPGDPLRYHSHLSAVALDSATNSQFSLSDIVAAGRLGTGVKKAFCLGAPNNNDNSCSNMNVYCIEWAGFG